MRSDSLNRVNASASASDAGAGAVEVDATAPARAHRRALGAARLRAVMCRARRCRTRRRAMMMMTPRASTASRSRVIARGGRRRRDTRRNRRVDDASGTTTASDADAKEDARALDDVEAAVFDGVARGPPAKVETRELREMEARSAKTAPGANARREAAFREMIARNAAREDNASALARATSVDALLVFGCDGVLPEIVNGRVAMIGVVTGIASEVITGKGFAQQLAWNLTHGVSEVIIAGVIVASCLPAFKVEADGETVFGTGACKWKRDGTARAERGYLVDPLNLDPRTLPGKDTVLGRVGFVPFVEMLNARLAMLTIIALFVGEPLVGHPFFTAP